MRRASFSLKLNSLQNHGLTNLQDYASLFALQNYASHSAVYCNRGINVNSILSVEKVRRFVCKHLRPM